jgi:hypothetical protein
LNSSWSSKFINEYNSVIYCTIWHLMLFQFCRFDWPLFWMSQDYNLCWLRKYIVMFNCVARFNSFSPLPCSNLLMSCPIIHSTSSIIYKTC